MKHAAGHVIGIKYSRGGSTFGGVIDITIRAHYGDDLEMLANVDALKSIVEARTAVAIAIGEEERCKHRTALVTREGNVDTHQCYDCGKIWTTTEEPNK